MNVFMIGNYPILVISGLSRNLCIILAHEHTKSIDPSIASLGMTGQGDN